MVMIRVIAAIDSKYGLAKDKGIPWKLPTDVNNMHELIKGGVLLMGYRTYKELDRPPEGDRCFVLTDELEPMRQGFEPITELGTFMKNSPENLWLFGGANLFAQTIKYAEML